MELFIGNLSHFTKRSWTILICGFYCICSYGQDVENILNKFIEENGGVEAYQKFENVIIKQNLYLNSVEVPQKTVLVNKESIYQESEYENGKHIIFVDKEGNGWEKFGGKDSNSVPVTKPKAKRYLNQLNFLGPIYDYLYNKPTTKVKSINQKENKSIDFENCHVLEVVYKNDYKEELFISSGDFKLLKITNSHGETFFSNYKETSQGLLVAFSINIKSKLGSVLIDINEVLINQTIDSKIYDH